MVAAKYRLVELVVSDVQERQIERVDRAGTVLILGNKYHSHIGNKDTALGTPPAGNGDVTMN